MFEFKQPSSWFVALMVDELAIPLTFEFREAGDAYEALRHVRTRYPSACVRRSAVPRLASTNGQECGHD
jgi:hypothetical protein